MTDPRLLKIWRITRIAAVAFAVGSTALVGSGASTTSASAGAVASTSDACLSASPHSRVRSDSDKWGEDPNSLTLAQSKAIQSTVAKKMRSRKVSEQTRLRRTTVDVYIHVITRDDGTGTVSRARLRKQVAVLNDGFAGRTSKAAATTKFRFRIKAVDYTANSDWYDWDLPEDESSDTDEGEATLALHRGGLDDLNIYVTGLGDGLLGYAYYPWEATPTQDGVVLLNESLPGGAAAPYNEGDTATHEVGHWFGLAHTFENGCAIPGDFVADTPYQNDGDNIFSCNKALNTCPSRGKDPVHNFMSYGDDPCLNRFTTGQSRRMSAIWLAFRSNSAILP